MTGAWPDLPIDTVLPELARVLAGRASAVLVADPGAGKTTRVPLALLEAPWRGDGRILVLEPRRLAARAAAEQMARLLGEPVGGRVGYRVRLESRVSAATRIEVVTEGVFTRRIIDDPALEGVAAVLFDEFHERSLDADFGLALALDVQGALRPDLRILVMSATLDSARVADLLDAAPVVRSQGRAYPVETRYLGRDRDQRIEDAMAKAIRRALDVETGSILAFLPGAGEIERTAERLREEVGTAVDVAPLYGALDPAVQDRAIRPAAPGRRKVVLATSIAETSLTIEGVRVVIDSGLARVPRFEPSSGLTRLETVRVSRAAADQRRGRAGRLGPGVCWRLWDEPETRALPAFATPEILEADLAPLLLDCAGFGVADPTRLAFLDPPPAGALAETRRLLLALGALDGDGRLTDAGRRLARVALPPRPAHMLAEAAPRGHGHAAAELAVLLGERGLGGPGIDLAGRLARFRTERGARAEDARRMAERWARLAGAGARAPGAAPVGALLALAYPDRIARARPGKPGEFVLSGGRGAMLDLSDALSRDTWLAVVELQGGDARGRITAAAALSEADALDALAPMLVEAVEHQFDAQARAVRARRVRRAGAIILSETPVPVDPDAAARTLAEAVRRLGLGVLPWSRAATQLRDRIGFLNRAEPDLWPEVSEPALLATLETWLMPFAPGASTLADLSADVLHAALGARLDATQRRRLDGEAPTHFEAPTGSRVPVDYEAEAGPTVSIRVQELYGLARHPALAGGRVPLVLELLSPAHRPIQVTRDLPGFWAGSWAGVRAEMRGRYPRHLWPEDPAAAAPTTRAKPRGT